MPTETVAAILSRAVAEPEFRAALFHAPSQALAGYALTDAETATLSTLRPETFDASAADLGVRMSYGVDPSLDIALPTVVGQ